ncbi:MAG: SirB1 family protein [Alphaproteobacteria bacterium]
MEDKDVLEDRLRAVGRCPDADIDIGETALLLAACDRRGVALDRYREHLTILSEETGAAALAADDLDGRLGALRAVMVERHGYTGDRLTYDDLQNANLLRVIDRRKGLPVALGILALATSQRLGWDMVGLNFPGHFLLRLDHDGARAIVDPFDGCRRRSVPELRELLKAGDRPDAELLPAHYAPVSRRAVLLRLQNNIKLRLLQSKEAARALHVVERMLWIAPGTPELMREAALLNVHLGHLQTAITQLEAYLGIETAHQARHRMATLLQDLRNRLN